MSRQNLKLLNVFISSNSDVNLLILSFLFGKRDYVLDSKYDKFYKSLNFNWILSNFDKCHKTQWLCDRVVKSNVKYYKAIPRDMISYELSLYVIKKNKFISENIRYTPIKFKTMEFYKKLLTLHGKYINIIPYEMLNQELCTLAVSSYPHAIEFVPPIYLTDELYLPALSKNPYCLMILPINLKTYENCYNAIKKDGILLRFVPMILLITTNICFDAVMNNIKAFVYVPRSSITVTLCQYVIKKDIKMMKHIPTEFMFCVYDIVVSKKPSIFKTVPVNMRNYNMCLSAVVKNRCLIKFVPKSILTRDFFKELVNINPLMIKYVPSHFV